MVKVATTQTIPSIDLARALAAKKTPGYANAKKWGIYSYEDIIYPQARLAFPEYNRLYDTNEEFTNYFVRDLNKKDSRLVKILGDKTVDKILIGGQTIDTGQVPAEATEPPAEATAGQGTAGSAAGGAGPVSSTGQPTGVGGRRGVGIPPIPHVSTATMQSVQQGETAKTMESPQEEAQAKTSVPKAYEKAFEGEPEYKTDPTKKPPGKTTSAPKEPAIKRGFQVPKMPAAFSSARKNFTSRLGIFFKRNTTGMLSGLFAGVGGFIGGGIAGKPGVLFGAIGGGLTPSLVKSGFLNLQPGGIVSRVSNFGITSGARFSNLVSGARSKLGGIGLPKGLGAGKKAALAFSLAVAFLGLSLVTAFQQSTSEASPEIGTISPVPTDIHTTCPVPQGSISTPSYNANQQTGHCSGTYGYTCRCGTAGRRAKAVDIPTSGKAVIMPTINDQEANWQLIVGPYIVDNQEGGGVGYTFEATVGADKWYLDMLHLNRGLSLGQTYPSGTSIGTSVAGHIHMTMAKNLAQTPVAGTNTDCDPNWLPSDFVCK